MSVETSPQWVIDPDSHAEQVRRMQYSRLINRAVGLFPQLLDLSTVYRILEIGCGDGEWTLEAARYFPVSYVGIDSSHTQIAYAASLAKIVGYDDLVRFEQADLSRRLPFVDESFDLVHARFLLTSLPTTRWQPLLHEVHRVLASRGIVLLSEAEWPTTNSPAMEQFTSFITQAMSKAGYGFGTDGRSLAILPTLPKLLQQQGWRKEECITHILNYSAGLPLYEALTDHLRITAQLIQPFLIRMGYGSQHDLEALCEQMVLESYRETFVGSMTILQTWAEKAETLSINPPNLHTHARQTI